MKGENEIDRTLANTPPEPKKSGRDNTDLLSRMLHKKVNIVDRCTEEQIEKNTNEIYKVKKT